MKIVFHNAADVSKHLSRLATRVSNVHSNSWAADVAEAGRRSIYDDSRVKTGAMRSKVGGAVEYERPGIRRAEAGFGIPHNDPMFYTRWQEYGTVKIKPMLALPAAAIEMKVEAHDSGDKMLAKIAAEWGIR